MNNYTRNIYIKLFRHFSERLALRYDILITFEDYVSLSKERIEVIETEREEGKITKLYGYMQIQNKKVIVVKLLNTSGTPLLTALPLKYKFKIDETWQDKKVTLKTNNMNFSEKDKERVKIIVADKLGLDYEEINDNDTIKDNLNADSLDEIEIIMEFEKEFDITIPDEDYENIKVVSDYYPIIERLL